MREKVKSSFRPRVSSEKRLCDCSPTCLKVISEITIKRHRRKGIPDFNFFPHYVGSPNFWFCFFQVRAQKEAKRNAKGKEKAVESSPAHELHDREINDSDDVGDWGDWGDWGDFHHHGSPTHSPSEAGPSHRLQDHTGADDPLLSETSSSSSLSARSHEGDQDLQSDSAGSDDSMDSRCSRSCGDSSDDSDLSGLESTDERSSEETSDEEDSTLRLSKGLFRASRLDQPVYHGSLLTLRQYLLRLLANATKSKMSMVSLGNDLQFQSSQALPVGNLLPASTYKLFQLLGINIDQFERHACVGGCEAFPPLDRAEFINHMDDKCGICKEPRFERRGQVISPRLKFYYLPIAMQMELLKREEGFDKSMERMAADIRQGKTTPYNSFWGAKLAQQFLDEPGMLDNFTRILVLSLGLDGVKCFKNGKYSVWPVGVKIWNLHGEDRTRKDYILLVSLVPGPAPPAKLDAFLSPVLEEIKESAAGLLFIFLLWLLPLGVLVYYFLFHFPSCRN